MKALACLGLLAFASTSGLADRLNAVRETPARHVMATGLDHVSFWAQERSEAERRFEQLGFNLTPKPGSYGAGISNKLMWFKNNSYIEFLWLSDPDRAKQEAPEDHAFASTQSGVREYAIQVTNAESAFAGFSTAGFKGEIDGSENWDPDGPSGPKPPQPSMWRNIFLERGQIPGNPFFIQYNLPADHAYPASYHPNGAQSVSGLWIVAADLGAAEAAYRRAGFSRTRKVEVPEWDLGGFALPVGGGEIFILSPGPKSPYLIPLRLRGDHVVAVSIKVPELRLAKRFVDSTDVKRVASDGGPLGPWVSAQVTDNLGFTVVFHQ